MSESSSRPRLAFLGTGPDEIEVLLEVRAAGTADIVGLYDVDPDSPGLALAEVLGIPAGCDSPALERLAGAEVVVLPRDRFRLQDAVRWAGGLRAELVPLPQARRRWGSAPPGPAPPPDDLPDETRPLQDAVDISNRLQDRAALADWLLGTTMRAVGANGGSIQLLAKESSELYLVAARGLSERLVRFGRHRVGERVAGVVAATQAAQLLHGPKPGRVGRERGEVVSSISLPLEDGGDLVGVLNVSSTVQGRRFDAEHVRRLEQLAPRLARLLRDATRIDRSFPRLDLPRLLSHFEADVPGLQPRLAALCEQARSTLGADAAALYLATEDGDWLCAHATSGQGTGERRAVGSRMPLDTARLEGRWVHTTAAGGGPEPADPLTAELDRALEPGPTGHSQVFAPLSGLEPVGVLMLEFAALEAADRCLRDGEFVVEQVGLCCDALVRDDRQRTRIGHFTALARAVHRLQEQADSDSFEALLASEAARLVGARSACVRRVDEAHHVYSRPVTANVDPERLDAWRTLDARVSERTLHARRGILTTAADAQGQNPSDGAPHCSLVSIPFLRDGAILALLNLYEKTPRDFLENDAFTRFDLELLECLTLLLAWPPAATAPAAAASPAAERAEPRPTGTARESQPIAAAGPMPAGSAAPATPDTAPVTAPVATAVPFHVEVEPAIEPRSPGIGHAPAPHRVLQEMLHEAAREQRSLGVWLLHFAGIAHLGAEAESARRTLSASVQRGLRAGDAVAWVGEQDLAVFGLEPPPAHVGFEARLGALVRPQLARLGRALDAGIELRIGASAFPADGSDATRLLAAAAERAR